MSQTTTPALLCECGHPSRLHYEGSGPCDAAGCGCAGNTLSPPAPEVVTKWCPNCATAKPVAEFHVRTRRGRTEQQGWCKTCMNARRPDTTGVTLPKLLRNRARHRATAELIQRHLAEFRQLQRQALQEATAEAAALAQAPDAVAAYASEPVRLRSGRRMPGETPLDRIDVGRCTECARHHDRGHVCSNCGAAPAADPAQATA